MSLTTGNTGLGLLETSLRSLPNIADVTSALNAVGKSMGPDTQYIWLGAGEATNVVTATDTPVYAVTSHLPTWTVTGSGAHAGSLTHPISALLGNSTAGLKLTGGTTYYGLTNAADITAIALAVEKITFAAPPTAAAVATTGTFTKTKNASYAIAWTVDTPAYLDGSAYGYSITLSWTIGSAVLSYYGTRLTFTKT